MVKSTTVESFQAAQTDSQDQPEPASNYLADLARKAVQDRGGELPHVGDPFEGMSLDVDPTDAIGLVEAQVRAWLEERDRWATPVEIRDMADKLLTEAKSARPGPVTSEARYSVAPDGTVQDYMPIDAERELPGMPGHPEAPAAEPIQPGDRLMDPSVWGKVVDPDAKATLLWAIPQNGEFTNGQLKRADDLDDMVDYLIRSVRPLQRLAGLQIGWKWKLKGGRTNQEPRLITVKLADKDLAHERGWDVMVHLSADHLRKMRASALFIERLVFDALARIDSAGPKVMPDDEFNKLPGRWRYGWIGPRERLYAPLVGQVGHALADTTVPVDAEPEACGDDDGEEPVVQNPGMWDGSPSDFERQESMQAGYADEPVCEIEQSDNLPDAPLVCSVCGAVVDLTDDEATDAREHFRVVLCEACGEDGVIDEGDA